MVHTIHLGLVLFSVIQGTLSVYIVNGQLPSRPLGNGERLDDGRDALLAETLKHENAPYVEQLYTTSDPIERGSVLVVYVALLPEGILSDDLLSHMHLVEKIRSSLAEKDILSYAIQRLRWKIEYTNVVYALLPKEFTLSEMQNVYEAILGKQLDKRNFRKKILSLGMLKPTGKKRKQGVARPAETYGFQKRTLEYVNVL